MFKLPFCLFAMGTVLYVSSISADPIVDQEMIAEGMKKMQLGISKAMEKLGGGGGAMGGAMGKLTEIASKISGRGKSRSKRSIETKFTETKMNKTDYQKVEMQNKQDNDGTNQQAESVLCLTKGIDMHWLEFLTSALIHISQEMKKILHGKTVLPNIN